MKKSAFALTMFTFLLPFIFSCQQTNVKAVENTLESIRSRGNLRVGFSTFIPWAMKDSQGHFIGLEVDVMNRLADDLGVQIEYVSTKWSSIIPSLNNKKFDVIIAGMAYTSERERVVDFTVPYYHMGFVLVANRKKCESFSPETIKDFNRSDVIFAEREGSTPVPFLKKTCPKAKIRLFKDQSTAYRQLRDGKANAIVGDAPRPIFEALAYPEITYLPLGTKLLTHRPVCFAVRKNDPEWLSYLNTWIEDQENKAWIESRRQYWLNTKEWEHLL